MLRPTFMTAATDSGLRTFNRPALDAERHFNFIVPPNLPPMGVDWAAYEVYLTRELFN